MPLFVEKPRNNNGYRFYDAAVIEGEILGGSIFVVAPKGFVVCYPVVDKKGFQQVSEKAGPARIPQVSEHHGDCNAWRDSIIQKYSIK